MPLRQLKMSMKKAFNLEIQVKYLLVSTMEPELLKSVLSLIYHITLLNSLEQSRVEW